MIERLDINDVKEWSEMDIWDLKNHVAHGATLEETAEFLCRGDTFEVARKAKELGLTWQRGGRRCAPPVSRAIPMPKTGPSTRTVRRSAGSPIVLGPGAPQGQNRRTGADSDSGLV